MASNNSSSQRADMLAAMQRTKLKLAESRAEAVAKHTPVAGTPAASLPSTPASVTPASAVTGSAAPDFLTFAEPSAVRQAQALQPQSLQQRSHFIDTWATKIEQFVFDNSRTSMELPTDLSGFDRKTLHQLANHYNLSHQSSAAAGGLRRLVLRKDTLFFAKAAVKPSDNAVAALKEQPVSHRSRRGHPDPTDAVPEKEQYADKNAFKAYRRLHKATDQYARAVETGMTEEDAAALAAMEHQREGAAAAAAVATDADSSAWEAALSSGAAGSSGVVGAGGEMAEVAAAAARGELFEVCTECSTRNVMNYALERWECVGPCEQCGHDTVWRLETAEGAALRLLAAENRRKAQEEARREEEAAAAEAADADRAKRPRDDGAEQGGADSDGRAASKALSPEELAELAAMHDMPEADVKWVEAFAAARARQGASDDHVLFCADFADFPKYIPSQPVADRVMFFARVAQGSAPALSKRINKLLGNVEKACRSAGGVPEGQTATQDVYVCFPAFAPAGGAECVVAILLDSRWADEATVKMAAKEDQSGPAVSVSDSLALLLAS